MKNKKRNKTYAGKLTKYQRKKEVLKIKLSILMAISIVSACAIMGNSIMPESSFVEISYKAQKDLPVAEDKAELIDVNNGTIREITMFNSLPEQTDDTPCISADGTNICEVDYNVCATNAFPFGTKLYVDGLGECIVKDRMNTRYRNAVDFYAGMDVERAKKFGRQNLLVSVLN